MCRDEMRCSAGGSIDCHSMQRQVSFPDSAGTIVDVGAGEDYVLAVDASGAVFGWGDATRGLVGNGCCFGTGCTACQGGESQSGGTRYFYYTPKVASELRCIGFSGTPLGPLEES